MRRRSSRRPPAARTRPSAAAEDGALALVVAADVVREAEASRRPADRLLRAALRDAHLAPEAAALAARAVFAWFRWRGLVHAGRSDTTAIEPATLRRALALAARFAREPAAFDDAALCDAALPGWLGAYARISAPLVRALQAEPRLWLRARHGAAAQVTSALAGARAGMVPGVPDAVRYAGSEDLFRTPLFAAGRFEIQDIASQAVGVACAPRPGEKWWDACAGEGGKTLHLADLMQNRGVVWASDRSAVRLGVLRRRAARAGLFNYRLAPWDGGMRLPTRTQFDGVLVDAPCTGVGTWHRNPHARWTTGPADVGELAGVQTRLLDAAARAVRPGGRLVYAVCTLTRAETHDVADQFARAHADFVPAPFVDPFAPPGTTTPRALWEPPLTGGNGMFVAAWWRTQ